MEIGDFYAQLLELAWPWTVKSVSLNEQPDSVDVYLECAEAAQLPCPRCDRPCAVSGYSPSRTWRHMDTCIKKTFLHAGLPVVDCPVHGKQESRIPWAGCDKAPTHSRPSAPDDLFGKSVQENAERSHGGLPLTTAFEKWIIRRGLSCFRPGDMRKRSAASRNPSRRCQREQPCMGGSETHTCFAATPR